MDRCPDPDQPGHPPTSTRHPIRKEDHPWVITITRTRAPWSKPTGHRASAIRASASSRSTSTAYEQSHLRGAVGWNWTSQLADGIVATSRRRRTWASSCRRAGSARTRRSCCTATTTTGSPHPAYWRLKLFGLRDVRILNGGRKYWLDNGLPVTTDVPKLADRHRLGDPDFSLRAFRDDVLPRIGDSTLALVDVRSPAEFNGEVIAPPGMSETAQRAGHIPGAASIPWAQTVREDGTFKSREELAGPLRGQGHHGRQGHHRLLPDR